MNEMKKLVLFLLLSGFFTQAAVLAETREDKIRQEILSKLSGEWIARSIYVAAKLRIADHLWDGPKTLDELSELCESNSESLERLLGLLASQGIFMKKQTLFSNNEASRLLSPLSEHSLHSLIIFYGETIHQSLNALEGSIRSGKTAFEISFNQPVFSYFKEHPQNAQLFQNAMREKSKAVIGSSLLNYDFSPFQTICDVGGGQGYFLDALVRQHPHMKATLFDLPEVIFIHRKDNPIKLFDLCEGDFFQLIPSGYDAYLLKSVLHDWEDAKAQEILENCHKAMNPESRLLIIEVVLNAENNYAQCMDLLMLAVTGGKERSLASFRKLLNSSGFEIQQVFPTSTEFSIIEAVKK